MTLQVFDTNSVGSGNQIDLGTADDLWVQAGVLIATTDASTAITAGGNFQTLHIEGQVVSLGQCIEIMPPDTDASNEEIYLGTNSVLRSYNNAAITLFGSNHTIEMAGKVFANVYGLQLLGGVDSESFITNSGSISSKTIGVDLVTGDDVTLDNTGMINGAGQGIYISGTGDVSIVNSGTIKGAQGLVNIGTGSLTIENSGVIRLGAELGDQSDSYDGRSGRITGTLEAGAGDDTIKGGAFDERFDGGAGRDLISGGKGADMFIYVDAGDSTSGAAGRDLIGDFSQKSGDIVDFSQLVIDELDFVGTSKFSGADEIRYQIVGNSTFVYVNLDSDKQAELAIELTGKIKFVEADFAV